MTLLYVQFADDSDEVIISYFGGPQPDNWTNQGTVDSSDPRWSTYFYTQPLFFQQMLPQPTEPEAAA